MYTLFIDTHSELITVALYNEFNLFKKEQQSHYEHAVHLIPMIENLLKENNLTVDNIKDIVTINGPGSFTGLRIGLSVAKTMAYTLNIPIYLISSLTSYLISDNTPTDKMVTLEDNKGYYISIFDKNNKTILNETYIEDISNYNYYKVPLNLNLQKIINYAKQNQPTPCHLVRANYVKKIEVEK